MPDAGSQLAEYFEAATERIDADDVFAAAAVQRQLREHRAPQRRVRPAWALAAGFLGVVVLVGGVMLSTWLAQRPDSVEPATFSAPVSEASGSWDWWPLAVVGGLVIAGTGFVLFLRRRRATKEVEMKTLDEKQQEAHEAPTPRRSRRPRFIGLAILVVLAGAITTWAVIEANQRSDIELATQLVDEWIAGWNAADPEAVAAVFAEDVRQEELANAQAGVTNVSNTLRTSELRATDTDGTFRWTAQFDLRGYAQTGEWEIELDGDLAARIEGEWSAVDDVRLYSDDSES